MAIYKRAASPYWWYSFKFPGRPQICASTKTTDKKSAEAVYHKVRAEIFERKNFKKPKKMSVTQLLDWCFDHYWRQAVSRKKYEYRMKAVVDYFGKESADSLKPEGLLKFRINRINLGVSKSTVNRELSYLKAAYYKAMNNDNMLAENPVAKIEFYDEKESKRDRYLSQKEKDILLSSSNGDLHRIIFFALKTGMRQGEILGLKWEEVDVDRGHMKVISRKGKKVIIRYVPIFPQIYDLFASLSRNGDKVFSKSNGDGLTRNGIVHSSFARLIKRLKIPDFKFHDLRHTFASDFLAKGGTLTELAKIMGHTTTTMTERYGHLSKEHLLGAINVLPRENYFKLTTVRNGKPLSMAKVIDNQLTGCSSVG